MPPKSGPYCAGSASFNPERFFSAWQEGKISAPADKSNDLRTSIRTAFDLPENDPYVYHAIASVTLAQVQTAVNSGAEYGLHSWYRDGEGQPV